MKTQSTSTSKSSSDSRVLVWLILLVAIATAFVHWPAISAKAVMFDDDQYLTDNPVVQTPGLRSTWILMSEVLRPSTVGGYYQPLAMISLMVDCALGGRPDDQRIFHTTSLALHVLNTVLVVWLLYLLFHRATPAALVGLLFGVHPMHVESIPWLAERKTVLAAAFALGSLIAYVRYAHDQATPDAKRGRRLAWYSLCFSLFALALLSKPTTTPLPVAMLLMDVWPLRRFSRRCVMEKIPFLLLSGVSAVVTVLSQRNTAEITRPEDYPASAIPLILCHNIVFYLRKLVWPSGLSGYYPFPGQFTLGTPAYLVGVIGTLVLFVVLAMSLRWTRAVVVGWLIFFVTILPTMGVIGFTAVIAADRFVYLPMIGLLLPLAAWMSDRWMAGVEGRRRAMAGVGLLVAAALALGTRNYLALWQDNETFTQHMLRGAPDAPSLRMALGHILLKEGKPAQAVIEFQAAVETAPGFVGARLNLARALLELGRAKEAETIVRVAVEKKPTAPEVHTYLGMCLEAQGRLDEALVEHELALSLRAFDYRTYYNLATLLAKMGRGREAIARFEQSLSIRPDHSGTLQNMGLTLFQMGRADEAIPMFERALQARPDMAVAAYQLGCAKMATGRIAEALTAWRDALRIDPGMLEPLTDLAWVLATTPDDKTRNGTDALLLASRANQLSGGNVAVVLDVLAAAQAESGAFPESADSERRAIASFQTSASPRIGGLRRPSAEMQDRLNLYQSRRPYRGTPQPEQYLPLRKGG
ncbi:MAG: tetratricopeptide repeat protein [Planctomycetota bacterium]